MAKRFTDTDKWKHPTYRQLSLKAKLTWQYLLDQCDHAGLWLADYELASFQLGFALSMENLASWFGDRIFVAGNKRIFIPDFVRFQYNVKKNDDLEPNNKAHLGILREFQSHGVCLDNPGRSILREFQDPLKPLTEELPSFPGVGVGVGVGVIQEDEFSKKQPVALDFEAIYKKYPRKEGKPAGLLQCRKQIKTREQYDQLSAAVDRYAQHCAKSEQIVKHFSSFLGSAKTGHPWLEWLDPETGSVSKTTPQEEEPEWKREIREREAKNAAT